MNDSTPHLNKENCYRLVGAIISRAVEDANLTDTEINNSTFENTKLLKLRNRKQARLFFYSTTFADYCSLTGLSAEYVRTALTPEALKEAKQFKKEQNNARERL